MPVPGVEPNTVVNELKKTYFYKDTVLRHGQVVVAEAVESAPTGQHGAGTEGEDPTGDAELDGAGA